MDTKVGIYRQKRAYYSCRKPFLPPEIFAEYAFESKAVDKDNEAYASLRELLRLLGLDEKNFGKKSWNPFGSFIKPGHTVLLKPNLVRHFSENRDTRGLITHGSLIRAASDYAYIALQGKGRIIIADGPMDDADFGEIANITGIYEIQKFYKEQKGFDIEVYDLRQEKVIKKDDKILERVRLEGDTSGYTVVNLGDMSAFKKERLDYTSFRGAESRPDVMLLHHNKEKDEYLIANTFLNADAVINIPKMKTHKRAGVTLCLKNIVGITGDRNWLPHYSDTACVDRNNIRNRSLLQPIRKMLEFMRPLRDWLRQFVGVTESTMRSGNWYGNDIIWRSILDLWKITVYADKEGIIRDKEQRKTFVIVDGIIAGESDGPTNPSAKRCGVLVAGFDWPSVDMATTRIMGFDPMKIPKFKGLLSLMNIVCVSNVMAWNKRLSDFRGRCLRFKPHYGWKGHIEAEQQL